MVTKRVHGPALPGARPSPDGGGFEDGWGAGPGEAVPGSPCAAQWSCRRPRARADEGVMPEWPNAMHGQTTPRAARGPYATVTLTLQ